MYIKTDTALVNLSNKDIAIRKASNFATVNGGQPPFKVSAEGPVANWLQGQGPVFDEFLLFGGSELECTEFLAAVTQCIMADVTIVPGDTIGKRIHGRAVEAQS